MAIPGLSSLAKLVAGKALASQLQTRRYIDPALGIALMRDGRIPARTKALTMAVSLGVMTGLVALELPVEAVFGMVMPVLGYAADFVADGAEESFGTLMLAAILLPHLAPRAVVDTIRSERAGTL